MTPAHKKFVGDFFSQHKTGSIWVVIINGKYSYVCTPNDENNSGTYLEARRDKILTETFVYRIKVKLK